MDLVRWRREREGGRGRRRGRERMGKGGDKKRKPERLGEKEAGTRGCTITCSLPKARSV